MEKIKQRILLLQQTLHTHNHRYYVLDNPIISDFEFDHLLKELQVLEEKHPQFLDKNSPTQRVGGGITKSFKTEDKSLNLPFLSKAAGLSLPLFPHLNNFIFFNKLL